MAVAKKSKLKELWCFSFDGDSEMYSGYESLNAAESAAREAATEYSYDIRSVEFFKLMKTVEIKKTVEFKEVK